jgi:hypothetical protein
VTLPLEFNPLDRPMTGAQCGVLRAALRYVVAHPDEHNQELWGLRYGGAEVYDEVFDRPVPVCRTVFCLAGHVAVTVLGARPTWAFTEPGGDERGSMQGVVPPGQEVEIDTEAYARRSLGLPYSRANRLFSALNSLRRVAELAFLYSDGRVDVLDRLPAPTDRDAVVERDERDATYAYASLDHARWLADRA